MNLSDQISELRGLEDTESFQGPQVLARLAKLLSKLEICDGWLYHRGCGSAGGKRSAGTAILHGLLQDALHERGLDGEMQSARAGEPGSSAEIRCSSEHDHEDRPPSVEAMLAAYIQALKASEEERPGAESCINNIRR